jgi:hypothetical protein
MCNCSNCKENEFELVPELQEMLGNYTGAYHNEYETGGGRPTVAASPPFVRNFSGPAAECTSALTLASKTQAQALAIINAQIAVAIRMLRVAADKLKQGSRSAATNRIFQQIFRVPPSFVPTWLQQTANIKDRGDVVAVRCSRVADLLASGRIKFFCSITTANCPDCDPPNIKDFACSSWGNEGRSPEKSKVICLGEAFWNAMKKGDTPNILSTVMHEPFHIYFGIYVTEHPTVPSSNMGFPRKSVGKFGGVDCIVRFVFEINGQRPTALDVQMCNRNVVRS